MSDSTHPVLLHLDQARAIVEEIEQAFATRSEEALDECRDLVDLLDNTVDVVRHKLEQVWRDLQWAKVDAQRDVF